jgi:hypothetical protein
MDISRTYYKKKNGLGQEFFSQLIEELFLKAGQLQSFWRQKFCN